jgi:hypothetical protein
VVNFTPRPLYPRRKNPQFPMVRKLGRIQKRSGRRGVDSKSDPSAFLHVDGVAHSNTNDCLIPNPNHTTVISPFPFGVTCNLCSPNSVIITKELINLCIIHEDRKCIRKYVYCLQSEASSLLGRPTHTLEDKVKMNSSKNSM